MVHYIHSMMIDFIEFNQSKSILENTSFSDTKIEFSDLTVEENKNPELKGLKSGLIDISNILINEYKTKIEKYIKELDFSDLEHLKEMLVYDINKTTKEIEIADSNLHTYSKETKINFSEQQYASARKNTGLIANKYHSYIMACDKLNYFYEFMNYVDFQIDNILGAKTKK